MAKYCCIIVTVTKILEKYNNWIISQITALINEASVQYVNLIFSLHLTK